MSKRSNGAKYEKEAKAILEAQGWLVERAFPKMVTIGPGRIISTSHDFFGAFDLIAKKAFYPTLWVQVSTWEMISVKKKQVSSFPWTPKQDRVEVWGRVRGRGAHFRVLQAQPNGEWFELASEYIKKD